MTKPVNLIFGRKRPLAQRTLDRIAKGIRDGHHGHLLEPLAQAVEDCSGPVPLLSLLGPEAYKGLQAWTLGQHGGATARPVDDPVATIAASGAVRLIEALIVGAGGPARQGEPRGIQAPLPTLLAENRLALAEPFILPPQGRMGGPLANKVRPVDEEPVQTITGERGGGHLVEPAAFILPNFGERDGQHLRVKSVQDPLPTVHGSGAGSLAYLASYYGNGTATPVDGPLGAVTTKDRFALVEAFLQDCLVDVRLRMLAPKELAAAMGFPSNYVFSGTRTEVVKQIGNAVEVNIARALCTSLLTDAKTAVLDITGPEEGACPV